LKEAIDLDDHDLQTAALEQGMRDRVKRIGKTIIMQKYSSLIGGSITKFTEYNNKLY